MDKIVNLAIALLKLFRTGSPFKGFCTLRTYLMHAEDKFFSVWVFLAATPLRMIDPFFLGMARILKSMQQKCSLLMKPASCNSQGLRR